MNIVKYKSIFLGIALVLVVASIASLGIFGLKKGVDFTGGTLWQVRFEADGVERDSVREAFIERGGADEVVVNKSEQDEVFNIRLGETSESLHQEYATILRSEFGEFDELSFQSIGAVVGSELVSKAFLAVAVNLLAIVLYVAYAFRKVSHPVSSWKYSAITLLTLLHDAIIPVGVFALLGQFLGVEIDTNFIVATLVVMGFSVHDTIVVFDRIRENLRHRKGEAFDALVNRSINETFARSVNTSLTLIVVLIALFFLGASNLSYFVLVILLGTVLGTYSSIFVASPLLVLFNRQQR